jgi:endoglucanase
MTHAIDIDLLKTLTEAWGPSGYEDQIRALITGYVKDLAVELRTDVHGNLICKMGNGGKKIMIAAHMDEIGLFVTHLDRRGFGRFSQIGALIPNTLHGAQAKFADGTIAVIGADNPFGGITREPMASKIEDFFLDFSTGLDSQADVKVGAPAALVGTLLQRGDRVVGKSLDDRICCAVLVEAMRRLHGQAIPNELYFCFTTQEETGVRGARLAAEALRPDYAIALDVIPTGDVPAFDYSNVNLGAGVAIKARDLIHVVPTALRSLLTKRAVDAGIAHQPEVISIGTTDASGIQISGIGVPSCGIGVPVRHVHTRGETADLNDMQACIDLLVAVVGQAFDV